MSGTADSLAVTVVIAARNEQANIVACIDSVRWAAEIIVADHNSSDCTGELAARAGATVISPCAGTVGALRNFAIERARNQWILVVDADERGTYGLARAIRKVLLRPVSDAYRVRRRNFFFGKEIRHGGWDADRPVRLFRSSLRYNDRKVHEHVVTAGKPAALEASLLHCPYPSLDAYFEKLIRYSRWWAEDAVRSGRQPSIASIVFKPPTRFLSMFVLQRGFLDGVAGAMLASLGAASVAAKYAMLWWM